jgi:hypothetical protein
VTRDERETECYEWLFVVAAGVRGPRVWVCAASSGLVSQIGDQIAGDQTRQSCNLGRSSITSYNLRDLMASYNSVRLPCRRQTDPGSNPVLAACKAFSSSS